MPAELTRAVGEKGFPPGNVCGSLGGTFCVCCEQVSHVPSSSETRSRLSLKRAVSLVSKPGTGFGTVLAGLGRGPGSFAFFPLLLPFPLPLPFAEDGANPCADRIDEGDATA